MTYTPTHDVLTVLTAPFLAMSLLGAYLLFVSGPGDTIPQYAFRVAVFSIGTAGILLILMLKALLVPKPPRQ